MFRIMRKKRLEKIVEHPEDQYIRFDLFGYPFAPKFDGYPCLFIQPCFMHLAYGRRGDRRLFKAQKRVFCKCTIKNTLHLRLAHRRQLVMQRFQLC